MTVARRDLAISRHARSVPAIRQAAERSLAAVVELATTISEVPAPTKDEGLRADLVEHRFREAGLTDIRRDELHDVVARVPGRSHGRALLLAAHLDTVFDASTALTVVPSGNRVAGPGIGDNSVGVAVVLALPRLLEELQIVPAVDLLLTGNVGEEGLGNLAGIKRVMDDHPEIGAVVAIEGHNLGRVTHVAVGSVRLRVTVTGPGGHSWGDFGNPNAIHAAAGMITDLDRMPLPQQPKTTLSVGLIEGGISVNTIAPTVSFVLDLRSTDALTLERLKGRVTAALRPTDERVSVDVEVLGERPAGFLPISSRIVQTGIEVLRLLGHPASADASSTDANPAINRGIPAICVGLTTGGNVHTPTEFIDVPPVASGIAQLVLLVLSLGDELAAGSLT